MNHSVLEEGMFTDVQSQFFFFFFEIPFVPLADTTNQGLQASKKK